MPRLTPDHPTVTGDPRPARGRYTAVTHASAAARAIADAQPPARIVPPTLTGPVALDVGATRYGVPEGSRIAHSEHDPIAYVATPQGGTHVLLETGELDDLTPQLRAAIRRTILSDP